MSKINEINERIEHLKVMIFNSRFDAEYYHELKDDLEALTLIRKQHENNIRLNTTMLRN